MPVTGKDDRTNGRELKGERKDPIFFYTLT